MSVSTLPDFLYLALFGILVPLWDYFFWWPAFERRRQVDPARARLLLWQSAIAYPWIVVAIGATIWMANDRSWSVLNLTAPVGWRLWTSLGLILALVAYYFLAAATVARDPATRAKVKRQMTGQVGDILPRTARELFWFGGVSLTAGFCEELVYRGFFIWTLAPWLGWWGAAGASVVVFAFVHAYQGWSGILRTGVAGAAFTALVAILGSLWPVMILHALVDLGSGVISWLALRDAVVADA